MCLVSYQYLTSPCAVLYFNDCFDRYFKASLYQRRSSVLWVNHVNCVVAALRSKLHIEEYNKIVKYGSRVFVKLERMRYFIFREVK